MARRHDLNTNLLFSWRRALRPQRVADSAAVAFVPAVMAAEERSQPAAADRERTVVDGATSSPGGRMEIVLAGGCRAIVDKYVSAPALARVIGVLTRQ